MISQANGKKDLMLPLELPQIVGPERAKRHRDQQLAPLNQAESPQ